MTTQVDKTRPREVKRKLAAILSADVKGYSRLMGEDEKGTVRILNAYKDIMTNARNSTFTYKGKPVKVKQVAEELGVRYVLEGSVRRSGEKVPHHSPVHRRIDGLSSLG